MPGILVLRLKGMGDIVHLLPSLELLRRSHPGLPIGFVSQKPFGEIIPDDLDIERFDLPGHATFGQTLRLVRSIRCRRYDRLFDLFGNPRTALLSLLSGIPWRAGFPYRVRRLAYGHHYAPPDGNVHLMQLFGDFFSHFGLGGPLAPPRLALGEEDRKAARAWLTGMGETRPLLGINPHATYPSKAWPMAHFAALARRWQRQTGRRVLVFGGPGEEDATRALIADLGPEVAFSHPPLTVRGLIALLAELDRFVTADTGPMNLAWALRVPTVALFGPTTRKAVAPVGTQHLTLYHPTLDCLQCHKEVCPDGRCMSELSPDYVWGRMMEKAK